MLPAKFFLSPLAAMARRPILFMVVTFIPYVWADAAQNPVAETVFRFLAVTGLLAATELVMTRIRFPRKRIPSFGDRHRRVVGRRVKRFGSYGRVALDVGGANGCRPGGQVRDSVQTHVRQKSLPIDGFVGKANVQKTKPKGDPRRSDDPGDGLARRNDAVARRGTLAG